MASQYHLTTKDKKQIKRKQDFYYLFSNTRKFILN